MGQHAKRYANKVDADDTRVKVVYEAPSLHLFCSTLHAGVGMNEALYTTFTFVSSLPCLYTFGMPSLPLFFNGFYSCEITPVSSHAVTILSVVDKGLELVHVLSD